MQVIVIGASCAAKSRLQCPRWFRPVDFRTTSVLELIQRPANLDLFR
jgi:hypothetical protein